MVYIEPKQTVVVDTITEFLEAMAIDPVEFIQELDPEIEQNILEIANDIRAANDESPVDSVDNIDNGTLRNYLTREYRDGRHELFKEYLEAIDGTYTMTNTSSGWYKITTLETPRVPAA
jgi:hypothetical protein